MAVPAYCITCQQESRLDTSPLWQRIALDTDWRVTHSLNTSLPGWLVLVPRRHVVKVADLSEREASSLGSWQVRLSRALHAVTGCTKTYVAQFAEAEGFDHVHFHVVPRMADLDEQLRGPRVFGLIGKPAVATVNPAQMNKIAQLLSRELQVQPNY